MEHWDTCNFGRKSTKELLHRTKSLAVLFSQNCSTSHEKGCPPKCIRGMQLSSMENDSYLIEYYCITFGANFRLFIEPFATSLSTLLKPGFHFMLHLGWYFNLILELLICEDQYDFAITFPNWESKLISLIYLLHTKMMTNSYFIY